MLALSEIDQIVHATGSNPQLTLAAVGLGVLVAILLFKPFFEDWAGFWECIKFWFTPDWISLFRGQGVDDWWATMKLHVWFGISVVASVLAFYQLPGFFPHLFHKVA